MENKKKFWDEYNLKTVERIMKLINTCKQNNRPFVYVDFHIHSIFSSDGKQSLETILENTKKLGFEIVSITDHDSVKVYDELYELSKKKDLTKYPIVITGIEHTVSYPAYGHQCHIMKHFINPLNKDIIKDIKTIKKAYQSRSKVQIRRLKECQALQDIFKEYHFCVSYSEFCWYCKNKNVEPDYAVIVDYLADKMKAKGVPTKLLYEKLKYYNKQDPCEARKKLKSDRYEVLDKKYSDKNIEDNRRFMLSILAVKGLDDFAFSGYPSSGSLSVDEYGQPDIYMLNSRGVTTFAHPTENVAFTVLNALNICGGLTAVELNIRNKYKNEGLFDSIRKKGKLCYIIGSDTHSKDEPFYEDMSFYKMPLNDLEEYIEKAKVQMKIYG